MKEIEIWSEIEADIYHTKIKEFNEKFGQPKTKRRLSFRFGFNSDYVTNTRIRITNGYAEIMHKTGSNQKTFVRNETEYAIDNEPNSILKMVNFFRNILKASDETHFYLIQFENSIWDIGDYEIKLTH
ncbi:MAG: hypothetical protein Q9M91_06595 [Candidatus Dojkabacteria bacterium]|nr:hypothetical protein [Candidatus Dojkabacteria bacterium]MDQ7021465.1 hypothetical protein [Candidatus Dojkabacteria bacterium]